MTDHTKALADFETLLTEFAGAVFYREQDDIARIRAALVASYRAVKQAPSLTVGEREAFATAAKAQGYSVRWCEGVPDVVDGFDNAPTAHAWKGWQLRAALAPAAQTEPVAWKHDCAALLTNDVELWISACPHCGKPAPSNPPAQPITKEQP